MTDSTRYWTLFAFQSFGGAVMLWKGIPFYRDFLSGDFDLGRTGFLWALVVITCIQPGYWISRKMRPPLGAMEHVAPFMGHVVLFVGRLTFVFIGGLFSAIFYMQASRLHLSVLGLLLLLTLLFSMFCYTLEIERLGRTLLDDH